MKKLLFLLLLPVLAQGQIVGRSSFFTPTSAAASESFAFVGAKVDSADIDGNGSTPQNFTYTVSANTQDFLEIWIEANVDSITGVTVGGSAATKSATGWGYLRLYTFKAPATGSNTIAVSYTECYGRKMSVCIAEFKGVDQTTPLGTVAYAAGSNESENPGNVSIETSSATGEIVTVGTASNWNTMTTSETVVGYVKGATNYAGELLVMQEAGATTTTTTVTVASYKTYRMIGVAVKPASP